MLAILFCMSCKSQELPLNEYKDSKITFGNEGGFAGTMSSYQILEDGRVFLKGPKAADYAIIKKMPAKVVAQLFSSISMLELDKISLNDPGNLTYFINLDGVDMTHELRWGAETVPVDEKIKAFHRNLIALVKVEDPLKTENK